MGLRVFRLVSGRGGRVFKPATGCSPRERRASSAKRGAGLGIAPREIQDQELKKFCLRITGLLQKEDLGNETIDCLQRLFLIVSATKYYRKLEKKFVELLLSAMYFPKSPEQVQVLCAAILREISPSEDLTLFYDHIQNTKLLSLMSSVLLAQGNKRDEVRDVGLRVTKILESRQPEGQSLRYLLPVLSKVITLSPKVLKEDQINLLNKRLIDWLRYASIQQGVAQISGGFFSNPRARQPGPITEVDGAVATDFFTVLSVGQHYTEDQWLNMQAFSMLRKWLLYSGNDGTETPDSDDKSELEGSIMSMVSATSTSSRLLPPKERLRENAFEYCQRLIEQSNRRALKKPDCELQKACLVEAVIILDLLCRQDSSFMYRTLSCLKTLHGRLCGDLAYVQALLPVAQFFLNHSEAAAVDSEAVYQHLFTNIPSELFYNSMLAFEFIQFCRDNIHFFNGNLSIFKSSFPNLFKFLAWNSASLISEFVDILPVFIDASTAIEMLHVLLDLPCLTAALDLYLRSSFPTAEKPLWDPSLKPTSCLDGFRDPYHQALFQYLLRPKAKGFIKGLAPLHELLKPMAGCARVIQCAETVPILIQLFFTVVTEFADGTLINQLAVLLLGRSGLLFDVPQFKAAVHREMSSQLLVLCKLHPSLVVELSKELLEFTGTIRNIHSKENIFTHVVWAIGEYLSVLYDRRCTVELINKFFETLEALLFEITQFRPSATLPKCCPRVITVLMTTLTKLASRSQDLIPRVSLFLSKMRSFAQSPAMTSVYSEEDTETILTRATELMNLLKMPSVAQFVLTPSVEVSNPRYHLDTNTSLPLALQMASRLVEKEASLLSW
ncbi:AP-5 complex subunit zeta-1 isoform X2 [Monodelphis domestica]|uniref:AP-5 complex subunit zeta-1 isoform X2 n=1 Tax=Monodelphis domestica TaxID=13616 RepID=UPI0024E25530|nr:AP-5 complex subunit zeta-1 isoform X2 [Monodelphis domestica]